MILLRDSSPRERRRSHGGFDDARLAADGPPFDLSGISLARALTLWTAATITVAMGAFVVPSPSVAAAPVTVVAPDPTEAHDEATAMHLAWKNRKQVEILSERTESSETFAQPDGTLRTKTYASPTRVRRGSGWVAVNTDLKVADGAVAPEATTLDVKCRVGSRTCRCIWMAPR